MIVRIFAEAFHAAQQCTNDKDLRVYTNGVYLAPNGDCVGCDGYTLALTPNAGDFKDIPHRLIRIKDPVPAKASWVDLDTDTKTVAFCDLTGVVLKRVVYECETDELRYPLYDRIIPSEYGPKEAIALDGKYLARANKVFRNAKGIRFDFGKNPNDPAILSGGVHGTLMLIMPVRL